MRNTWILPALLGLSVIQCSSKDTPNAKYPDAKSFCAGMAAGECNDTVLGACLATSDKPSCLALRDAACLTAYVTPAVGLTYDSGKAQACVDAVSGAYSNALITAAEFASIAKACGAVFSGTGTKGTSCETNSDCKQSGGLSCVVHAGSADAGAIVGTCQVAETINAGESCSAPNAQCTTDHYCDPLMHCVAGGGINSTTGLPNDCSAAALCTSQFMCSAGKCVAKLTDGKACTSADQCANGVCLEVVKLCAGQETLSVSEPFCTAIRGQADGG